MNSVLFTSTARKKRGKLEKEGGGGGGGGRNYIVTTSVSRKMIERKSKDKDRQRG